MDTLIGIPGTISPEAKHIRWIKRDEIPVPGGTGKRYAADVADGRLLAIVSRDAAGEDGKLLWHVSVTHSDKDGTPDRCPNWDELKMAAYRLIPEDICLVLIFPRRSVPYANEHPTCLHLWEDDRKMDA